MKKRMLAIFAMIALTFAFGVGSALAAKGGEPGPPADKQPPPCGPDSDNPKGCEGHPGEDEEEPPKDEGGGECDPLAALDPAIAELCQTIVDALAGGELPAPPGGGELPQPPGGGEEPSCDQIPEFNLAGGCQTLVDAIGGNLPV